MTQSSITLNVPAATLLGVAAARLHPVQAPPRLALELQDDAQLPATADNTNSIRQPTCLIADPVRWARLPTIADRIGPDRRHATRVRSDPATRRSLHDRGVDSAVFGHVSGRGQMLR